MPPSLSIALIDSDQESRKNLEKFLKTVDQVSIVGTAADLSSGYEIVVRTKPMLVIMDLDSKPDQAFDYMEKMLKQVHGLAIFATSSDSSSENILRAMRSGATEFLLRPVDNQDLMNSLTKVGRLMVQRTVQAANEHGQIITCFSPKGGMGNTTIATNLAVCIFQLTEKPVVLVDLDLEAGDAAMFLNLKTKYTISDVTSNITRLDRTFLQGVLAKHSSGIYLLAEPQKVEDAENITPSQVREVLDLLKSMFAYIVVDTEVGYGDRNLAAFDASDLILLMGMLHLPSIKNMQKSLDVFDRLGFGTEKVKLIINRYLRKGEITVEDAEKALNYKVFWHLPNDYNDVMMSINRGLPLTTLSPHSEISHSFRDMVKLMRDYLTTTARKGRIEKFA